MASVVGLRVELVVERRWLVEAAVEAKVEVEVAGGKNGVRLPDSLGDGALWVCGWMMGNCCLLWCWK